MVLGSGAWPIPALNDVAIRMQAIVSLDPRAQNSNACQYYLAYPIRCRFRDTR
jgi:hypothetical protein